MNENYRPLFEPIYIGNTEIKNRYVMAPMASFGIVDNEGILTDDGIEYFVERARGGIGLIMTGTCFVEAEVEQIVPHTLMLTDKTDHWKAMQQFYKLSEQIHAYGGKIFIQLASGYGRSARIPSSAGRAVAPSKITNRWDQNIIHEEITIEEIHKIVRAFGEAANFLKRCEIDGVEIHAVHEGYLLDQFTVPYFNHRTDEYGGSFKNRYRFAVEIRDEIAKRCGKDFPVSLRYTLKHYIKGLLSGGVESEEFEEKGRDIKEGLKAAKYLADAGYDALNVDLGCYDAHYWNHPSVYQKDGLYLEAAAMVKKVVSVPVICAGRMDNPDLSLSALKEGKCDMIALGRPCLADPEIPNKIAFGKPELIRPCISCNYGCCNKVHLNSGRMSCAVNAQCAHELETRLIPAMQKKKIVVVGGGPAGCEFARVATLRGHKVVLFEKALRLGGAIIPASLPPFKHHDELLIQYFERELSRLGVDVHLNTAPTNEEIQKYEPDIVVSACGAKSWKPALYNDSRAVFVTDALKNIENIEGNVTVIGAGQTGVEISLWLLERGCEVTIIEITDKFMPQSLYSDAEHAQALLNFRKGKIMLSTTVTRIDEHSLHVINDSGEYDIPADTIILATGFRGDRSIYDRLRENFPIVYNIGDSVKSRNIYYAVHEAYQLASHI